MSYVILSKLQFNKWLIAILFKVIILRGMMVLYSCIRVAKGDDSNHRTVSYILSVNFERIIAIAIQL